MDVPVISFRKILYPTDLSETGRQAFAHAASLAHHYQAGLTVLHVVDENPELDPRLAGYLKEEFWEQLKRRDLEEAKDLLLSRKRDNTAIIRECVGSYCREIRAGSPETAYVSYEIAVRLGEPVREILAFADEGGHDLLVIGKHSHGPLHDLVLGSIAQRLLRQSPIPALVVPLPV